MNEQLQQQLMEFVYGLLDEGEAHALCERITSDPQVARAYATVKLQCDLVARAARYDTPTLAWSRLVEGTSPDANVQVASKVRFEPTHRRLANWCIGVAASGLICLVGSAYWMSSQAVHSASTPLASVSATPVHVVVTGPSELNAEANNPFTIQVESEAGTPVSTTLNLRVYDIQDAVSWEDSTSTDARGVARFDVDSALARDAARLEVTTADDSPAPILRELETSPETFVTYLRMDRPLYQPGESVLYRSVTLSRYGLRPDREVSASFEIVNSVDQPIAGSTNTVDTEHGVGSGEIDLPSDLPDGTYTLIARSPDNLFREEWRDFHVRRFAAPRLLKKLELAQDSYTLGDRVDIDFSVKRVSGEPLAESLLQVQATLDGLPLAVPQARTDAEGNSRFSLSLPESIERGEASVSVTVQAGDDLAETISREIPINLGQVNVDFYPEGGDLAAELPSRVYFYGRDPVGKPTHIEGRVVDSGGNEITSVVTGHEGRGVFSLTPVANEQYRLVIEKPVGVTKEVSLPVASADSFAAIETGDGVFAANAPIAFTLHQRSPPRSLILAAYCRGAMVAQQTIDPDAYGTDQANIATFRGNLSLPAQVQGVVRLTVFDAAPTPPEPIAERLVYRRVGQQLKVRLTPSAETFSPGQAGHIDVQVRDENDTAVPAVLGISIVDDAILNLADDKSTRMPTYFHLLSEIDTSEQLEDANFYVSDETESVAALDSLLGTQGWRRFRDLAATQLVQSGGGRLGGGGMGGGGLGSSLSRSDVRSRRRSWAWTDETVVPISTSTTIDVRDTTSQLSTRSITASASIRKFLVWPVIFASIVLLTLVVATSSRWAHSNRSLRVLAGALAVVSLVFGVLSLPARPIRLGRATDAASAPAANREVASASDERMAASAAEDAQSTAEPLGAISSENLMFKSDEEARLFEPSMAAAASEIELAEQPKTAPQGAARFADPGEQLGRGADAAAKENVADLALRKDKKAATPSLNARPVSEAAAKPNSPLLADDALVRQSMLPGDQAKNWAAKSQRRLLTREYAYWFYDARASIPPTDQLSTTLFWHPLFMTDATGKATVSFNLPPHVASFRAIVEAHGADRLGAGELLINSR